MPSAMSVADVCLSLRNLDVPSVGVEVGLGILLELCQGEAGNACLALSASAGGKWHDNSHRWDDTTRESIQNRAIANH